MKIREMRLEDYEEVINIWKAIEGIGLHDDADSKKGIGQYLEHNKGLSFVACEEGQVIGTVLCGFDGRRGYLNHLAVKESYRRKGIGRALVENVILKLKLQGITGCNILVYKENMKAKKFWAKLGWVEPKDIRIMWKHDL